MLELERARCRRRDNFASVHAQRDGSSRRFGKEVTEILSESHSRYLLERRVLWYDQNIIHVRTLFFYMRNSFSNLSPVGNDENFLGFIGQD